MLYSVDALGDFLAGHPEELPDFILKTKSGLEAMDHPWFHRVLEEEEHHLGFDFDDKGNLISARTVGAGHKLPPIESVTPDTPIEPPSKPSD